MSLFTYLKVRWLIRKLSKFNLSEIQKSIIMTLGNMGPDAKDAIPILIKLLGNSQRDVVISTVIALEKIGKESIPALIEALEDHRIDVCEHAAETLEKLGVFTTELKIKLYIRTLMDEHWSTRASAEEALENIGEEAVSALIKILEGKSIYARGPAARVLSNIIPQSKKAIPPLILALEDKDDEVRNYSAKTLGNIGTKADNAIPFLIKLSEDNHHYIRESAVTALGKIGFDSEDVISALTKSLEDNYKDVRNSAAQSLEKLNALTKELKIRRYTKDLGDSSQDVRNSAMESLDKLGALTIELKTIRYINDLRSLSGTMYEDKGSSAIEALVNIGKSAIPILVKALNDKDLYIRTSIMDVLEKIGWTFINLEEEISYNIAKKYWSRLVEIGTPAIPYLIKLLSDSDHWIRKEASRALLKIDDIRLTSMTEFLNGLIINLPLIRNPYDVIILTLEQTEVITNSLSQGKGFNFIYTPPVMHREAMGLDDTDSPTWKYIVDVPASLKITPES